ncbi:carbonic anhydrase [Kitasatospora cineracea]|uniref:Carbonic anhydrase n=1 Tax=Kitasatospora cineracea TaxID=88074 RepID=A0A8G1XFG5_9ACTN|nr:carbonic anhydrase [Kitasatospora cineracea]ROR46401.1 carbonic anhydrase [Kitasatospora cineracea]
MGTSSPSAYGTGTGVGTGAVSRRQLLRTGTVAAAGTGLALLGTHWARAATAGPAADAPTSDVAAPVAPSEALDRLREGNARWVAGMPKHPDQSVQWLHEVSTGQHPFAAVFSCIDSRVPPELVFDQGLGDLFVLRTAAHTLDELVEASVEYGPLELATPAVVVLGHQRCGAVTAAVEAIEHGTQLPAHLPDIVKALRPSYTPGRDQAETVDLTVRAHIRRTVARLGRDAALRPLVECGGLRIAGAYYSLDDGSVSWL